ncbi:MAG TPA: NADH-quinone oxidoreductase subunit N [Opitutaceae bacterium]|nr:NADH-quinone oxidoreductase subunit N [Opitutaceae bacterium]
MNGGYAILARALAPEAALVAGALAVLGVDLAWLKRHPADARRRAVAAVAALAVVAAIGLALAVGRIGSVAGGALRLDTLALAVRLGVLVLTLGALGITPGAPALRHPVEYVAVMLFAAAGLALMAAADQLLSAFLALELASLSLYVLTGFDKTRPESAEAALKYFLFGGMAAAFLLFGFSLLYGLTGSIGFAEAGAVLAAPHAGPLAAVALVMVLVAFGFKIAAAPFHLWAPDVYQGAPAPSAALIASASKLAGYALFARLLWAGGRPGGAGPGWLTVVAVLAGASLLLGNLVALAQSDVRRLLAYSAIAHAGALLLGVMTAGRAGFGPLVYYAATYGLASLGAFGVLGAVARAGGGGRREDLAGLHRRSPLLAACLAVFVLSLAGIPPLAGFWGKFAVFAAALQFDGPTGPAGGLALAAIALTAVALYYYLLILKQALVAGPPSGGGGRIAVPAPAAVALVAAAGLLVLLGLFPSLVLGWF